MASRTIFLDAMTTPDNGTTKKHLLFALSLKDGSTLPGWPVDVSARVTLGNTAFHSSVQNQRGVLAFVKGTVYVPYGGHYGDCGDYHAGSSHPGSEPGRAKGLGGGRRELGTGRRRIENGAVYITTGNTFGATTWEGGEALLRFSAGPVFSGQPGDYFTPTNW